MLLVHVFFWASLAVVVVTTYQLVRLGLGRPVLAPNGKTLPWWVFVIILTAGGLGIASSAPGLFFDSPHWLGDTIYRGVERVFQLFT